MQARLHNSFTVIFSSDFFDRSSINAFLIAFSVFSFLISIRTSPKNDFFLIWLLNRQTDRIVGGNLWYLPV